MRPFKSIRARLVLAAALTLGLARIAEAAIIRTWISTASLSVAGFGHDVALSPANDAVYVAGQRQGQFYVGKYSVADGSVMVEYSTTTGYALGVGVGALGQVGVIGGILLSSWTYVVAADTTTMTSSYTVTRSSLAYAISILDPAQLKPIAGWPVYTTGYYDLDSVSTTNFRASAAFDATGNLFVGFNASSTTAVIRKYSGSGAQIGADVTISSSPYIYFEQLAVDTTTIPSKIYSIVEAPRQIQINAYNNDLSAFAGPLFKPWSGTDVGRRQSITVGANRVITGGQKYDNVTNPINPYYTWAQQIDRNLATNSSQMSYQFATAVGGNSSFGLAQRPPGCGAYYSVGDSTGVWVGLFDGALNYTNVRYYDVATALRGNAIVAAASREVYVTGRTKAGFLFVSRFDDNSCGYSAPPPPQPCTVTPSAFPNPFKLGRDSVKIQYDLLPGVVNAAVPPDVTLSIYGPDGALVKTMTNLPRARFNTVWWDGRNNQSALVRAGNYDATLKISVNPQPGPVCRSLIRMGAR
ncbi:MAG: hypothetical protein AAB268_09650 [Elusimicrobiota bacterium]